MGSVHRTARLISQEWGTKTASDLSFRPLAFFARILGDKNFASPSV
jgi:hypothetical protein